MIRSLLQFLVKHHGTIGLPLTAVDDCERNVLFYTTEQYHSIEIIHYLLTEVKIQPRPSIGLFIRFVF